MYCPICDQKPMNCDCTPEERRMHSEIEDLEEQIPRWIPVTERMPDQGARVLFFVNRKNTNYASAYAGEYVKVFDMWAYDLTNEKGWAGAFVTHWMPLPAPPTNDK
jgi:hypothetical protein